MLFFFFAHRVEASCICTQIQSKILCNFDITNFPTYFLNVRERIPNYSMKYRGGVGGDGGGHDSVLARSRRVAIFNCTLSDGDLYLFKLS